MQRPIDQLRADVICDLLEGRRTSQRAGSIDIRVDLTTRAGLDDRSAELSGYGPVVADMLCYLRVYTELAIRAKAVLIARENGLDLPVGERTRARFDELGYLERSIGRTGCLAMRPFLQMERKDLWQLRVLARGR